MVREPGSEPPTSEPTRCGVGGNGAVPSCGLVRCAGDADESVGEEDFSLDASTLEDFELLDHQDSGLGKGSFGVVQKIRRKGTSKVYALKSMRKHEVIDGNLVDQVELEIQVQRKLKHRNVLRLYRHFEDADTVFLLLEFCAKGELYQILRTQKCRRFTETVAARFFVQASEGLMYLHAHNIVHRDIKPENLLVDHDDVLKIADFGWCAMSQDTLRTTFCGTLDYLAPEMIQAKGHDQTLDVWSAGVLLYEMVVGRPPFQSTNHGQLIAKILNLELRFPHFTSPKLQDLVKRLLKTEPTERLPLAQAIRHTWVLEHSSELPAPTPTLSRTDPVQPNGTEEVVLPSLSSPHNSPMVSMERDLSVEQPEHEPPPPDINRESQQHSRVDVITKADLEPVTGSDSAAGVQRGLQSPRVPVVGGGPGWVTQTSPPSTPSMASRTLAKDVTGQMLSLSSALAPQQVQTDELSRTWGKQQQQILKSTAPTMAAPAMVSPVIASRPGPRQPGMPEPPMQSVVYRPMPAMPGVSPITPAPRDAGRDGGTAVVESLQRTIPRSNQLSSAPTTPVQRTPFRTALVSPQMDAHRPVLTGSSDGTEVAVIQAMSGVGGAPPLPQSQFQPISSAGPSATAPSHQGLTRHRQASRAEHREPSLQHTSSQNTLQPGNVSLNTSECSMASPKLQTRRLSAAVPNQGPSQPNSNLNLSGSSGYNPVEASPYPGHRVTRQEGSIDPVSPYPAQRQLRSEAVETVSPYPGTRELASPLLASRTSTEGEDSNKPLHLITAASRRKPEAQSGPMRFRSGGEEHASVPANRQPKPTALSTTAVSMSGQWAPSTRPGEAASFKKGPIVQQGQPTTRLAAISAPAQFMSAAMQMPAPAGYSAISRPNLTYSTHSTRK